MPKVPSERPATHSESNNTQRDRPTNRPTPSPARHGEPQGDSVDHEKLNHASSAIGSTAPNSSLHSTGAGLVRPAATLQGSSRRQELEPPASIHLFSAPFLSDRNASEEFHRLESHLAQLARNHGTKAETRRSSTGEIEVSTSKYIMDQIRPIQEALKDDRKALFFECYMDARRPGQKGPSIKPLDMEFLNTLSQFPLSDLPQVLSLLNDQEIIKRLSRAHSGNKTGELLEMMAPSLTSFRAALETALACSPKHPRGDYSLGRVVHAMKRLDGQHLKSIQTIYTTMNLENGASPTTPMFMKTRYL